MAHGGWVPRNLGDGATNLKPGSKREINVIKGTRELRELILYFDVED